MSEPRKSEFEHDGHRFETVEHAGSTEKGADESHVRWEIRMDGRTVLEFSGPFRYRDGDVRKRVMEWYAIQKPIRPGPAGEGD
jgi:hypothetical protein